MPQESSGGQGKSKPEMIRDVLADDPDLPAPKVRTAVWDRFAGEVTTQEITRERKKMRQADPPKHEAPYAAPRANAPDRKTAERPRRSDKPVRNKAAGPIRARDFAAADVTVKQLSAILEVAEQAGGLRRLHEAVRTVMLLREKVGTIDERQLAVALDFLAKLTGRR
jgi:hypothetical protein